ncbi:MAG: low-specificity L-threonine aldolase [Halopseudomonas sp.]
MIDYRSDTVTQPSLGMREAMIDASVGDDVYGEDPTVNALEQRVAALAGKDAALFVSSGTQSNLIALLVHCQRGEEYLVGQAYHSYLHEAGGAAVLGGIQPQPMAVAEDGSLDLGLVESLIKPDDLHFARTRLLALENTHHGKVIGLDYFDRARALANRSGLAMHLDGARVFNAAAALEVDVARVCQHFDSTSICFSKGLGAPAGSVLIGSVDFIQAARRWRKMLGGGMRQVGILAAAADYALDHHLPDLLQDHQHAQWLGQRLATLDGLSLEPVQTNMIYLQLPNEAVAAELAAQLEQLGIKISPAQRLRLVVHRDHSQADIEQTAQIIERILPQVLALPE